MKINIGVYRLLIMTLVVLTLPGCFYKQARKTFKESLKTCYSDKTNLADNQSVDLNGYYVIYRQNKSDFSIGSLNSSSYQTYDSLPIKLFFFKDGIYIDNFHVGCIKQADVQTYFNNIHGTKVDTIPIRYEISFCGTYKIKGDTIIAQSYFLGSLNGGLYGIEEWYQIIDKQTIKPIIAYPIGLEVSEEQLQAFWYNRDRYSTGKLVPLEKLPSSDCWLKKEKWFWCVENEWRNYMETNGFKIKRKDRLKK